MTGHTLSQRKTPSARKPMLLLAGVALAVLALVTPACGVGGSGADGAGQGLVLLSFLQESLDNATLNTRLEFRFSEDVDPNTVSEASIQIREGPSFGKDVKGLFLTQGSTIWFEPQLAGLCDHSDSGLKPDTQYRIQLIGFPEEFALRNMAGQALGTTITYEFHTRMDTDPNLYEDQIPGQPPSVVVASTFPQSGDAAVTVEDGNEIVLPLTENLDPCTINDTTVRVYQYESGIKTLNAPGVPPHPEGNTSGFSSDGTVGGLITDQDPSLFSWGAVGIPPPGPPRKLLVKLVLEQSFHGATLRIVPISGRFPENALIVVQLSFEVEDYGGQPLVPFDMSFTTENLPEQESTFVVENLGETPWDENISSAEINTARSPSLVQGFLLFAGDGDNGANQLAASGPEASGGCSGNPFQANDGTPDDFDPTGDVLLDTGSSVNTCLNEADGSTAVIWEFNTFRIRSGYSVRVVGVNPAIILVQGDVLIENGGLLKARGTSASSNGQGQSGGTYQTGNGNGTSDRAGGVGVAGGGNGGIAKRGNQAAHYSNDGNPGFGSPDYDPAMPALTVTDSNTPAVRVGSGGSGQPCHANSSSPWDGQGAAGGGGGHATVGTDGENHSGNTWTLNFTKRSTGGSTYEGSANTGGKMQEPEAGSGGGGGGMSTPQPFTNSTAYATTSGAGGAGGGFIDLTSGGDITVLGTLDVAGGRGGDGQAWSIYTSGSAGGGGSGGGARLLTPLDIILSTTSVVTAAGGAGGTGGTPNGNPSNQNDAGDGGVGRVVMETSAGIVTGLGSATVIPGEGDDGFYRGPFDANRFQGGGTRPQATSELFAVGAFEPQYVNPVQSYGVAEDFIAGTTTGTTLGAGQTAILIEAQGFNMLPDGTPDMGSGTGWYTVGHFTDSTVDNRPTWNNAQQPTTGAPSGTSGTGITNLNGNEFLQLRVTIYLVSTVGPFDPGSYLDRWTIRFKHDQ